MEGGDLFSRFLAYVLTASFKSTPSASFACSVCSCSAIECRCDCRVSAPTPSCTSEVGLALTFGTVLGFFIGLLVCGVRGAVRVPTEGLASPAAVLKVAPSLALSDLAKAQVSRAKTSKK